MIRYAHANAGITERAELDILAEMAGRQGG